MNQGGTVNLGCGINGFGGLLTIAFIVLKLCKVIDWSWIWVLAPAWISIAISLVLIVIIIIITTLTYSSNRYWKY